MKVDGITLLQMIRDGKIKESTLIEVSGGVRTHYPYVKVYGNKRLFWENDDEKCGVVVSDELLEYTFEIIEEIEKIKIDKRDKSLTTNIDEVRYYVDFGESIPLLAAKMNETINRVNYLLKKEEGKK